jgi:hypothetical protein
VDYDDTIFPWRHRSAGQCDSTINLIKWCQQIGAYIMIHTCSDPDRHEEIREYCLSKGLKIDSINENPIKLPYGNSGKPYYNWQLCDRSGLTYAIEVLREAAEEVITLRYKNKPLPEIG